MTAPTEIKAASKAQATRLNRTAGAVRITGLPNGTEVKVFSTCRYNGRKGTAQEHNAGEVGVSIGSSGALTWFRPWELRATSTLKARD
jgi:hypothetical protein